MGKDTSFLEKLQNEFEKYQDFPQEVREWIIGAIKKGVSCDFLQRLRESPHDTISNLDGFFEFMRRILRCDNRSLTRGTDFDSADLDPERFDAMIAELRAVGFLHDEGFVNIRLLAGAQETRSADAVALYHGTRCAVEIACSSRKAYRYPDHNRRSSDLIEWMVDKFHEKEEQLNQTAAKEGCPIRALVTVLNSYPALALLTPGEYLDVLRIAWDRLGKLQDLRLALVTGMVVLGHGLGDCVFPPWSGDQRG
jgi:hypothetical protein